MTKTYVIIILASIATFSCRDSSSNGVRESTLQKRILTLEKENIDMKQRFDAINDSLYFPLQELQKIIIQEYKKTPRALIEMYDNYIDEFPYTFWAHEAKRRRNNIKNREKYYDFYKGWVLPKELQDEIIEVNKIIECPGC
jgi:hypothetical protein